MIFLKSLKATLLISALAAFPVHAQSTLPQIQTDSSATAYVETFEGEDQATLFGGQLRLDQKTAPWLLYVVDGKLVMENRVDPTSLHFNDVAWVRYPNSAVVETTQNAVISAVVEVGKSSTGGVGIIVGSGKAGAYLAFLVDAEGRYHLFKKDGRQLRAVISEPNSAIRIGRPNELSYDVRGANIAFLINGREAVQIESPNRLSGARRNDGRTGVGIASFGLGTFYFDSVEISKGN